MKNSIGSRRCFNLLFGFGLFLWAAVTAHQIQAQSRSGDNFTVTPLAAAEVPAHGTFWSLQRTNMPPWPLYPPFLRELEVPVYLLDAGRGVLLVDDSQIDYEAIYQQREEGQVLRKLEYEAGLMSAQEYWALEGGEPPAARGDYPADALWLEITGVSNQLIYVTVHGTIPDTTYEILGRESLLEGAWAGETPLVLGAAGQDWTATTVAGGTRTNLFLWARSWVDDDGDGLPTWWELENGLDPNNPDTGDTGVPDGYKDGDHDGWTNLQEYQNGTNPGQFNTPAAPAGLVVQTDATGTHAKLTWLAANGPVTGYTVQRGSDSSTVSLGSSSVGYVDSTRALPTGWYYDAQIPTYRLRAEYSGGSSEWTALRSVSDLSSPPTQIISGQNATVLVALASAPPGAVAVRVGNNYYDGGNYLTNITDIPLSQFTNGVATLSATSLAQYSIATRFILTNSALGAIRTDWYNQGQNKIFWDGRAQLKDNLRFLLRAAPNYRSFNFWIDSDPSHTTLLGDDYYTYAPRDYVFAGYYENNNPFPWLADVTENIALPFEENHLYRNFVLDAALISDPYLLPEWITWAFSCPKLSATRPFNFELPSSIGAIPSVLTPAETTWLTWGGEFSPSVYNLADQEIGASLDTSGEIWVFSMTNGAVNWFGLPYVSIQLPWDTSSPASTLLYPGHDVPFYYVGWFYPQVAQPEFKVEEYYFGRIFTALGEFDVPIPGHAAFSITNQTPLLITAVGRTDFKLFGYAKLAVTNGYAGVYGYLGQYFDKAYTTTNGVATTNEAGWVSPYGQFIPTEPGRVALVTLPDLETNERGTATVYVVSMNLDANHDGVMERTFFGPDQTSANRPFRFWVNNDCDWATYPGSPNFDPGFDKELTLRYSDEFLKDYLNFNPRSVRDLEDYARLWICGVPALTNAGYQVTLSWANVSGNPAINLLKSVEPDGGTRYLTDANIVGITNIVWQQIDGFIGGHKYKVPTTSTLTLPSAWFTNADNKYLLFEGAGIGSGELVLTISQNGTNVLARTSAWLDLRDVKDFYERVVITNSFTGAISNWSSGIQTIESAKVFRGADTNLMVFVHGINNTVPDWLISSDTIFKRLYWSGYQGKVATVNWPCKFLPPRTHPFDFNLSEYYAYLAATGFKNYLTNLQARFPTDRLHILAHSQGNAVASEAIRQGAPFDTYILTQGAIPANCFDTTVTNLQKLVDAEAIEPTPDLSPMGYRGIYTNLTGRIVNFYNPIDYALATGTELYGVLRVNWEENERLTKPDGLPGARNYTSDGTNGYSLLGGPPPRLVTDSRESRGMVARSRTKAVGAQAGVEGVVDVGLDLQASYGFSDTRNEHSAQFARPIQSVYPYYQQILIQIQPAQ